MSDQAANSLQPTTAKGRATRQAILDAAEEVFGELSHDRTSISEITRRAAVAQGTYYLYFPDKSRPGDRGGRILGLRAPASARPTRVRSPA